MDSDLPKNYRIREMNEQEFNLLFQKYRKEIFAATGPDVRLKETFTEEEKRKNAALAANMGAPFTLRLGVFDESENFVGWHFGFQESAMK